MIRFKEISSHYYHHYCVNKHTSSHACKEKSNRKRSGRIILCFYAHIHTQIFQQQKGYRKEFYSASTFLLKGKCMSKHIIFIIEKFFFTSSDDIFTSYIISLEKVSLAVLIFHKLLYYNVVYTFLCFVRVLLSSFLMIL
jgi:hypothetical protein